ncbi:AfsR/SARP family transcriptional regulator [Streptomyces mashuensis]|uniref:AfsR/SARP family transcriptional regulator n=1 Tax=Streptomyces mashuensis TaxID=33904 RepID=UPI00167E924C|nr:BTAD domain-containing putative transcriptional regulator [Streptomyces mashuensis]
MSTVRAVGNDSRTIAFSLLGPLTASVGEEPVAIEGRRQRVVLALLVLARGRAVPADVLARAVWGEHPPVSARTHLALCVRALRRAFRAAGHPGPLITTAHPGYRLHTDGVGVDAQDFEALVDAACEAAGRSDREETAALCRRALALWKGPALEDAGGRVAGPDARHLEERRRTACEVLLAIGRRQAEDGYFEEAEDSLRDAAAAADAMAEPCLAAEAHLALARLCGTLYRTAEARRHLWSATCAFRVAGLATGEARAEAEALRLTERPTAALGPLGLIPRQSKR